MRHHDPFENFDRDFAQMEKLTKRTFGVAAVAGVIWLLFIMGAIGTVIFLLGRWLAVW
jgi:hypothetical protein